MSMLYLNVEEMTEEQAKKHLITIIDWLDELDEDDYFGTEGWRHVIGFDD